jgi:hypothetical protein
MRFVTLAGLAVLCAAMPARQPSVLVVTVGEVNTGAFIADAQVRIPSLGRIARTKWDGEARFANVREGRYRIQVRAIGYAPGDVDIEVKRDTASVHFELEKLSPLLDTVRVKATRMERHLDEFEARRRQGIGRFITDSVLAAEHAKSLQLLLVSHVPGLKVVGWGVKSMEPALNMGRGSRRSLRSGGEGCPVAIYVDGFEVVDDVFDVVNLDPLHTEEVAGIEVYSRSTAPVQYRPMGNYCKVILLWMKW